MTENFDSDCDLPISKKKIAKFAFAGSLVIVGVIVTFLTMAFDSFQTALANIGIAAPISLSLPMLAAGLIVLFVLIFSGIYYALTQYARRQFLQLGP